MTLYGYARVSTEDQEDALQSQLDLLLRAGVEAEHIAREIGSTRNPLPIRDKLIAKLAEGDLIVVFKLDRIGRSLPDVLDVVARIDKAKANVRTLDGLQIDTSNAAGRLIFHILAAVSEFERDVTRERMLEGVRRAQREGKYAGRAKALRDVPNDELRAMVQSLGAARTAKRYGVARSTVYLTCNRRGISLTPQPK